MERQDTKIKAIVFQGYLWLKGNPIIFESAVHGLRKFHSQQLVTALGRFKGA